MISTPSQFLDRKIITVACKSCWEPVVNQVPALARFGIVGDACADAESRRTAQEAVARLQIIDMAGWDRICPPEFQLTLPHKLPFPSKLQRVMNWQFGAKGLILH